MFAAALALEKLAALDTHLVMRIRCSQCGSKMLVHVGMTLPSRGAAEQTQDTVNCLVCNRRLIPLVPGPIIEGPFGE